jgi:hypothetical protein
LLFQKAIERDKLLRKKNGYICSPTLKNDSDLKFGKFTFLDSAINRYRHIKSGRYQFSDSVYSFERIYQNSRFEYLFGNSQSSHPSVYLIVSSNDKIVIFEFNTETKLFVNYIKSNDRSSLNRIKNKIKCYDRWYVYSGLRDRAF